MITPSQIRAARALLSWDAAELSKRSGIARATIFNIENGVTHGRDESLSKIRKAFEAENLEFIDGQGVRFRPEGVDVLSGREGLVAFLDDVYSYLSANGGVVCTTNIDEQRW
ncbi:MAG: helix-turn-helix transcriptional regulator, partial [Alphaproteobacteria bacterium]|nr:helix-turn-helix transcriptional regulator [Alphaproteobacteria bacterium]